ncbi:Predicted ferric reductase [Formivibrio citricus]|uniref:Predicted ferric reductase n=1 Tax=Formivibrio citricus TaxID=83765 RepID=A0A1I5CVD7_9NEIS|nr:ferric reductase-like transmembrane domain-containing protein [Formivibrio citricus]SFN90924.1 Predicted ferric reductase [Formivibrio citricus]
MTIIKRTFVVFLVGLSALWLWADNVFTAGYAFFALRAALVNYTGIVAIGAMSVCMILALRSARVEAFLDGLDKTYRLHKWLGIAALAFAVAHWLWAKAPKWMVGWGWLTRPARRPAAEQTVAMFRFFQSQRGLAEQIGEWAFYVAAVLLVLALLKRFPYRLFFKTHRLLAITYLFLVFHSLVLMRFGYWSQPVGWVVVALMAAGTVAAFIVLFRGVGRRRQVAGEIAELVYYRDNCVLKARVALKGNWPGHKTGQFAFVTFDPDEGPHPFTISSVWRGDGKLDFHIKALGDYTRTLPDTLKAGAPVRIEGPYGCFDFAGAQPAQIWVAGGIGIASYLARLEELAQKPGDKNVDLFYCTRMPDEGFIGHIRTLTGQAGVRLHLLVLAKDGVLDAERLCREAPQWQSADFWFCGPVLFGQSLQRDLVARGLPGERFRYELFEMR